MSRIALINIDTQQSFHHTAITGRRQDVPAFQQAMLGLTESCQSRGIPSLIFSMWDEKALSLQRLCQTDGLFTS